MPLVRTLRTLLTNNLPEIIPEIQTAVSGLFDQIYDSQPAIQGTRDQRMYWGLR